MSHESEEILVEGVGKREETLHGHHGDLPQQTQHHAQSQVREHFESLSRYAVRELVPGVIRAGEQGSGQVLG